MADDLDAYYSLENDIDCTASATWNSGAGFAPIMEFTGTFDGQNYTIDHFAMNRPGSGYGFGIFGTTSGATIKNFAMTNVDVVANDWVGAVAGRIIDSTVENIQVQGDVLGGLGVGGVIGIADWGVNEMSKVSMVGTVTDTTAWGGGVIGYAVNMNIDSVYFNGTMTGTNTSGGITGNFVANGSNTATLSNCYAVGTLNDQNFKSGLVGNLGEFESGAVNVVNCFTVMTGDNPVAGLFARRDGTNITVTNSYFDQTAAGTTFCGADGAQAGCTAVNTDGTDSHHFESLSVEPIQSWTLDGNWDISDGGYPFLVQTVVEPYDAIVAPSAVTNLTIDPGDDQFSADWDLPSDNGGSPVTDYDFQFKPHDDAEWNVINHPVTGASEMLNFVDLRIDNGSFYDFRVAATNAAGTGPYVSVDNFMVGDTPGVPVNVALVNDVENAAIDVSWEAPSTDGGLALTGYHVVTRNAGDDSLVEDAALDASTLSHRIEGLAYRSFYDISVYATNAAGSGSSADSTSYFFADIAYTITTCEQLQNMGDDLEGDFVLANDIDCSDTITWNEGAGFRPIENFSGTLNGQNHKITDLLIDASSGPVGIFASTDDATLSNLELSGFSITALISETNTGLLIGEAAGNLTLNNVIAGGSLHCSAVCGGVVGSIQSDGVVSLTGIESTVELWGDEEQTGYAPIFVSGGVVGDVQMIDSGTFALDSSVSEASINTISEMSFATGGFIGDLYSAGSDATVDIVDNHYLAGTAFGGIISGGLVGYVSLGDGVTALIDQNTIDQDVSVGAFEYSGGAIGQIETSNTDESEGLVISNIASSAAILGVERGAGLVATIDSPATPFAVIESSYSDSQSFGALNLFGGLAAVAEGTTLRDVYFAGDFEANGIGGGLIAQANDVLVTNGYAAGSLAVGGTSVGGIIGVAAGTTSINDSFSATELISDGGTLSGSIIGEITNIPDAATFMANVYNDENVTTLENCAYYLNESEEPVAMNTGCYNVDTPEVPDETYFYNSANEPFDAWDFDEIWRTHTSTYPTFQLFDGEPEVVTYTVNIASGTHGTTSPQGAIEVEEGEDLLVTVSPDDGYVVAEVLVDEESVELADGGYTFSDVSSDHTFSVTFKAQETVGEGDDSNSGPVTTTTRSSNTVNSIASTVDTEEETETKILLNDFANYFGEGVLLDLEVNDVIYFMVNGEEHSATVKEIGDGYIVLTLASTPHDVTIALGQSSQSDVTGDEQADIAVTYVSVVDNKATLKFRQLALTDDAPAVSTPRAVPSQQNATATQEKAFNWQWIVIAVVVVLGIVVIVVFKRKSIEKKR